MSALAGLVPLGAATAAGAVEAVRADPFTPVYAIQGSGSSAAVTGTVTTQGVAVGDFAAGFPRSQPIACRSSALLLVVKLADGTFHQANFRFS